MTQFLTNLGRIIVTEDDPVIEQGCATTGKSTRDGLLRQLKNLGLKHCTSIGSAPNRKGIGYFTHLAPVDGDFDPYVSPVFGETEDESLEEAIAEWCAAEDYTVEMLDFLAAEKDN